MILKVKLLKKCLVNEHSRIEGDLMAYKTIKNVGIFSHVDAGKTTLSENLLYLGGSIRSIGRVDRGTAHTDTLEIERKRGISVRATATSFEWDGSTINLIDTPGHADFYAEVERSMRVLDGAVLVISAVEGIQAQTRIIWKALERMNIPIIIFVNKIDRMGVDIKKVLCEISSNLTNDILPVQYVINEGTKTANISSYDKLCDGLNSKMIYRRIIEKIALYDEDIFSSLIMDEFVTVNVLEEKLSDLCKNRILYPVLFGSAINSIGIEFLIEAIITYLPTQKGNKEMPPSAVVYKIEHDKMNGRIAFIRVFNGMIKERQKILNNNSNKIEKVTRVLKLKSAKFIQAQCLQAGEIGVLYGLQAKIGDVLGDINGAPKPQSSSAPLLTLKIETVRKEQTTELIDALKQLEDEEPLLCIKWLDEKKEIKIQLMGIIQKEVISSMLEDRFGISVQFSNPSILYKETPSTNAEGYADNGIYTKLGMSVEPLERGKGIEFASIVSTDYIIKSYQNQIKKTIHSVLNYGLYGYAVTDVKLTVISGKSTPVVTSSSDFRDLTYIAVNNALRAAKTKLLEPMLKYTLMSPIEMSDQVYSALLNIRANVEYYKKRGDDILIEGVMSVATSLDFSKTIASLTGGKGVYNTEFYGYKECTKHI